MGFYTQYDGGNMIIPTSAFPVLQKALPGLLKKYQVEDVAQVIADEQARSDEIRSLLSVMRAIAADGGYCVGYGTETVNGEIVEGLKISFDEKKNWGCDFLSDLGPFLLPGTYIQVDDDDGDARRYVAKNGDVECVWPNWG